jgi:4-amino-4-deoxy-L-arabinose transferase-like glycosyltransferase
LNTKRIIPEHFVDSYAILGAGLKVFLIQYYPLLSVLIGFLLIAFSAGPFTNSDTDWEIDAVSGVLKTGLPLANGNYLINQPPLGFYLQAAFAKGVGGLSITSGAVLVTLLGLGCVALVYGIGQLAYNRTAGFFAALIFAFNPWHLLMSRTLLIDLPCLFFSLLTVFVGLYAIKRASLKLVLVAGLAFAAAFGTKLYAVFSLIPLLAALLYYRPRKVKSMLLWLVIFLIPVIVSAYLWYDVVNHVGILSIFKHPDFYSPMPADVKPTVFFVWNFLVSYSLGWFFIDALLFSLLLVLVQPNLFRRFIPFDVASVVLVLSVVGIDVLLGVALDLQAPFINAFKYDYQALPYLCILAGTLISKSVLLLRASESSVKIRKAAFTIAGVAGFVLFAAALYFSIHNFQMYSTWTYIIFKVEPTATAGYNLFSSTPILQNSPQMYMQLLGYAIAITGVLWIGRHRITDLMVGLAKRR